MLEIKSELTREELEKMIEHKKSIIGAGYLTDQGALFLIAADLGIKLSDPLKIEMSLKDLYIGAREITIETKVLCCSSIKQFLRKDDTILYLRTMIVYDKHTTATVKLWNEKAKLENINEIKPGDLIKITKAYVRSDIKGEPIINIGIGANIESVEKENSIPTIEEIVKDIDQIEGIQKNLAVTGIIDGDIQTISFINSRGQKTNALKLSIRSHDAINKKLMRVVLWNKSESDLPDVVSISATIKLLGVKTKEDRYGNIEIHGNETTMIYVDNRNQKKETMRLYVLSISNNDDIKKIVCSNENKNIFKINDLSNQAVLNVGDVIEFIPTKIYGRILVIDKNTIIKKLEGYVFPNPRTKINNIKLGSRYCIEAIVLKISEQVIIHTKNGEDVSMSEMLIEDDSGRIVIKGWRKQSSLIDRCTIGDIISIICTDAKMGLNGELELVLTQLSTIKKKN